MKDDKSRDFMNQYMIPNSRDVGIDGVYRVVISGCYTARDFDIIMKIFGERARKEENTIYVKLNDEQFIEFAKDNSYQIELFTNSNTGKFIELENVKVYC